MKQLQIIILTLLLLASPSIIYTNSINTLSQGATLQNKDTLSANNQTPEHSDDDFAPGLLFFALFALGCICVFVGTGIMLTLIAALMFIGLAALGVLSTSLIVMLHKKSFEKGFKTFIVLGCSFAGFFALALLFPFVNYITHWATFERAVLTGATIGTVSGFVAGQIVFTIVRRLALYLKNGFERI